MAKKKTVNVSRIPPSGSALNTRRSQLEALVIEIYAILCRSLTLYGISIPRQRVLFRKARTGTKKVTAVSAQLLDQFRSVSELLTVWLQELPYVDATGHPKVLPIRGRGATFESLARQFLPDRSIDEVVALACQAGSVGTLPGGRIAVYGDPMINIAENPEATLAQAICHITNIIQTVEFNGKRGRKDPSVGRFERLVNARLTPKQFEIFRASIRPQLDALCEHADRVLKELSQTPIREKRQAAGAGLGVYIYHRDAGISGARRSRSQPSRRR
jgi:Family of unknown function (DUF6502)